MLHLEFDILITMFMVNVNKFDNNGTKKQKQINIKTVKQKCHSLKISYTFELTTSVQKEFSFIYYPMEALDSYI